MPPSAGQNYVNDDPEEDYMSSPLMYSPKLSVSNLVEDGSFG